MASDKLGASLIETIAERGGAELVAELSEVALDAAMDSGVLQDVPILGTIFKLSRIGVGVREHLFIRKLQKFLKCVNEVSAHERDQFAQEMSADIRSQQKVGEALLSLLDKIDEVEKAELLGKAFGAYLQHRIDYETFFRLARSIDRCMDSDLRFVHNYERATDAFPEPAFDLASCGLIELIAVPSIRTADSRSVYKLTELGEKFVEYVLN